jgi:hypothetical protein
MTVKLMEPTIPLKPAKSGAVANEFFELDAFKELEGKFYVEPKYDGIRIQAHREGDRLKIFTDEGNEIQQKLPEISKEFLNFDVSTFIIDGELVGYGGRQVDKTSKSLVDLRDSSSRNLLPHEAIVSLIHGGEGEMDEKGLRVKAFDILWLKDRATIDLPLKERKGLLERNFPNTEHIHQVKYIESDGGEGLVRAIREVESQEGAVVKDIESHYTREHAQRWYKFKNQREIDAQVMKVEKTPRGALIYTCGVLDPEGHLVEIGKTFATSLEAAEGDIIRVAVDRVTIKDNQPSWLIPKVIERRTEKKEPDTMALVRQLARHSLWDEVLHAARMHGEFVLQRHWWGEAAHHDLRLTKRHGWFGFTLPEGDTSELKKRLQEGGKLLAFKKAYYGGMEWMEYGKDEVKVIPEGADYHGLKGNPSKRYKAYMKAVDWGDYVLEQRTETEFIISFQGEKNLLEGRYFIILAPKDMQQKDKPEKWLMSKAKEVDNPSNGRIREESGTRNEGVAIRNEEPDPHPSLFHVANHVIEVTIIKPGPAKVKIGGAQVSYSEEALKKSLPLWEGAAAFCDHFNKSVRNLAGVYFSPWWDGGVKAKLRFTDDTLYHLVEQIIRDRERGLPVPDIGISADIGIKVDKTLRGMPSDHTIEVQEITHVVSADIVFSPAAGGSFDRVLNQVRQQLEESHRLEESCRLGITDDRNKEQSDKEHVPSSPFLVPYEKRVRDLQSANDKLRAQIKNQQELVSEKERLISGLQSALEVAVAKYREYLLAQHPEIPPELVKGNTIEEINDSFLEAQKVVERVHQHLEEGIPAGAPARSGIDISALSPRGKIEYGLRRR